jgi:hypothetical protein
MKITNGPESARSTKMATPQSGCKTGGRSRLVAATLNSLRSDNPGIATVLMAGRILHPRSIGTRAATGYHPETPYNVPFDEGTPV